MIKFNPFHIMISWVLVLLLNCTQSDSPQMYREQALKNNTKVKITSIQLVFANQGSTKVDKFWIHFVMNDPKASPEAAESEAKEVFELIRPTCELWGIDSAEVFSIPAISYKGRAFTYEFNRKKSSDWSFTKNDYHTY